MKILGNIQGLEAVGNSWDILNAILGHLYLLNQ